MTGTDTPRCGHTKTIAGKPFVCHLPPHDNGQHYYAVPQKQGASK